MKVCLKVMDLLLKRSLTAGDPGAAAEISNEIEAHLTQCATCAEFMVKFGSPDWATPISSESHKLYRDDAFNLSSGQANIEANSTKESLTDQPSDFIAKKFLLAEFFWSLLLKHVRMLIAEKLATNEAKKEEIFKVTENAIRFAALPYDDWDCPSIRNSENLWTLLRSESWKVLACPSALVGGTGWFNHVKVTRSIKELEELAVGSSVNFLILCRHGLDKMTPVVVQLTEVPQMYLRQINQDLVVLTSDWPTELNNKNAIYAYVDTLAEICQHLLRDYVKQIDDTGLVAIEERIWTEARVGTRDSTLSSLLRYFCSDLGAYLGGNLAAWIFMPFPRYSDSLQVVAGSEPYPAPLFNPISVKAQDEAGWGLVGRAWVRNRMEISRDARSDPRVMDAEKEGVFQCIAVPLLLRRHRFPYIGGISASGITESAESSLWMCKLGVLYFGLRDRDSNLKPHTILLIRHLGQILSGLVASIVFSEYSRAGIVDDLFATSEILLDWIDPDQDWYAPSARNPLLKFINRYVPQTSKPAVMQLRLIKQEIAGVMSRFATDNIFFIVIRMNELEELLRPPSTDREAAGLVRTVKGLINESFLLNEEIGRDNCKIMDFEHDLLIAVANVYEDIIRNACNSFMKTYDLAVATKWPMQPVSVNSRPSIGILPVAFQELRALGFRSNSSEDRKSSSEDRKLSEEQDAALRNLKSKLGGVRRMLQQVRPSVPMIYNSETCSYREICLSAIATETSSSESTKSTMLKEFGDQ